MPILRVIIGQGTSTEVFRNTSDPSVVTIIFGDRGLWAGIHGHKMGQPPHALTLPGQKVPAFQNASGTTAVGLTGFLDSNNYQEKLLQLSKTTDVRDNAIHLSDCKVTSVSREQTPAVTFRTGDGKTMKIMAHQVIIATGIGPQQQLTFPVYGQPDGSRSFTQIQEGIAYINAPATRDGLRTVVVFGGGATSAWVAEIALSRKPKHFWWVARAGGTGFSKAKLPGHRNQMVLDRATQLNLLEEITIESLTYINKGQTAPVFNRVMKKSKLLMKFEWAKKPGRDCYAMVDQFIYSTAGDPMAEGSINALLGPLYSELVPLTDANRVLGAGTDILAIGTPSRDIVIIGAAAFSGVAANIGKLPARINAPMETLPWGSQVPDGIGVAVSTISALNSFIPIRQNGSGEVIEENINFNLADRDQLACYIAVFYPDMEPEQANLAVEHIIGARSQVGIPVAQRTHDKAFGISEEQVRAIIDAYDV